MDIPGKYRAQTHESRSISFTAQKALKPMNSKFIYTLKGLSSLHINILQKLHIQSGFSP